MPKDTSGLRRGGGRPKGVPNKATRQFQEVCREFVYDPQGWDRMLTDYRRGRLNAAIVAKLMDHGFGKPKETVALEGPDGGPLALIQRVVVDPTANG